ncbi:putative ankyrin repeat protein L25 [Tupanvirus soda lake]|uniref:Ankyrin repeat protein L25 n=2 Tax=Tupanvirus TaxID=2094720 RepID=A0AC62ACF7_9VIRU|nr:putative ankyrin repeat protein L25 [Tupanvirus soda lake]QKU35358.1 putative ankyrin repeat protein L25 [Tupanvirus soda lake]
MDQSTYNSLNKSVNQVDESLTYANMYLVDNIKKRFIECLDKGDQNEINLQLKHNIYHIPFDLFKYMVENGADPRHDDDCIFIFICSHPSKFGNDDVFNKLNYLLNLGANINAHQSAALKYAVLHSNANEKLIIYLLENGAIITDEVITAAVDTSKTNIINLLVQYGTDIYHIGKLFWKNYIEDYDFILDKMEEMRKNGLDLNQSISQFYSNKN